MIRRTFIDAEPKASPANVAATRQPRPCSEYRFLARRTPRAISGGPGARARSRAVWTSGGRWVHVRTRLTWMT